MRSETQPYSIVIEIYRGRILPGSSSPSHRKGPGTEVDNRPAERVSIMQMILCALMFTFCVYLPLSYKFVAVSD